MLREVNDVRFRFVHGLKFILNKCTKKGANLNKKAVKVRYCEMYASIGQKH